MDQFKTNSGKILKGAAVIFLVIGFSNFIITSITMPFSDELLTLNNNGMLILLYQLTINVIIPLLLSLASLLLGNELTKVTHTVLSEKITNQ